MRQKNDTGQFMRPDEEENVEDKRRQDLSYRASEFSTNCTLLQSDSTDGTSFEEFGGGYLTNQPV